MRKQVPPERTKDVLDFATKKPKDRLASIRNGLAVCGFNLYILLDLISSQVLAYGQSEYVRQFGMNVDSSSPLKIQARILRPPALKYGPGSKQPTIVSILCLLPQGILY